MLLPSIFILLKFLLYDLPFGGKGAAVVAEGLSGAVASGLGKVRYLN